MSEVLSHQDYEKVHLIIKVLEEKGYVTPKEAEKICGKSPATVRRYLNLLTSTGIIRIEGNTNNTIYKVIDE